MTVKPVDLQVLLAKGGVADGHRSGATAAGYVGQVASALDIKKPATIEALKPALSEYVVDVILSAAWYTRQYSRARRNAILFIALNAAMVVGFPIAIAALGGTWSSSSSAANPHVGSLVAQLTAVLTGILALQKTISAWYSQQQNYAGWYKCAADLKELYYSLLKAWTGKVEGREIEFAAWLETSSAEARKLLNTERLDYYTRLALPTFDVLDMLTASKSNVASLVTSLLPAEKETQAVAIGTKVLQGQGSTAVEQPASGAADIVQVGLVSTASLPPFDQETVDLCSAVTLKNSADVRALFGEHQGFFDWYNQTFRNVDAMKTRFPSRDTASKRKHFDDFWDQIPAIFGNDSISAIELCALMAVNLEESNGDLTSAPEEMNGLGRPHPGLAYAFDKIDGLKQTYNHAPNRTALSLFQDHLFTDAHGQKAGARSILGRPGGIDPRWGGDTWPSDVSAAVDPSINGFVMEADFFKFRGRGVIQTTWRNDYKLLIGYILSDDGRRNSVLNGLATRWQAAAAGAGDELDRIATISSNSDWDLAFSQDIILAKGVAIDSQAKNNYLQSLSRNLDDLNGPKSARGSLLYFAAHINGGSYPSRVAPKMSTLMRGLALSLKTQAVARAPRSAEIIEV
ncbi:hypothetical protein [Bradyrhizobium vignae]|uniref:Uncharacterized protein n=1 Tax=Bradyrhizobium vignae TaxID=1549949 RepID=A0A2U3PUI6_9BRAD|nr:hypothetical protein [Bradyrhizobium vignae]SPP92813.1 protein of unknown function [Bradyrhizobium vignae]